MVFTDLDGTLIDHDTYTWEPARPALEALRRFGAGVVLASSKTAAEMAPLRAELALQDWPAIVENGAGILPPRAGVLETGTQYEDLRAALGHLPKGLRAAFSGFGDMTADEVATCTGLSANAARLAKKRQFSEPGLWTGTPAQKADFLEALEAHNVIAQQGGRFLTLSFGGNKALQVARLIKDHTPSRTVALGDAPNDIDMLQAVDFGVIIANPHRSPLPALDGESTGKIIRTTQAGPAGWNTAILDLLARLKTNKEYSHG